MRAGSSFIRHGPTGPGLFVYMGGRSAGGFAGSLVRIGAAVQRSLLQRGRSARAVAVKAGVASGSRRGAPFAPPEAGAGAASAAPLAVADPVLPPKVSFGSQLTADVGAWASSQPLTFAFQWQACLQAPKAGACTDIRDATSPSYVVAWFDLRAGQSLRVEVTAWSVLGGTSVDSTQVEAEGVAPRLVERPAVSSDAKTDELSVTGERWENGSDEPMFLSYRWERCSPSGDACSSIRARPGPVYAPRQADVGMTVRVTEIATDPSGSSSVILDPVPVTRAATPAPQPTTPAGDPGNPASAPAGVSCCGRGGRSGSGGCCAGGVYVSG